jgi:ubiquinone/menaquinone biosynthesis C-methylase UbiE
VTGESTNPVFDRAADAYDTYLVPAFFDAWASEVTRRLGAPGDLVLDVGCGTGVLAPHLAAHGWQRVLGVDPSVGMLERASRRAAPAQWVQGTADALPLGDGHADATASSFALMFFPDPAAALVEMLRVTRAGGPVVVSTWASMDDIPAFRAVCDALVDVGGREAAALLRRAFSMGRPERLAEIAAAARVDDAQVGTHVVTARFAGISALAATYSTALGLGDESRAPDLEAALVGRMGAWTAPDGAVEFPMTGLFIEATGRGGR